MQGWGDGDGRDVVQRLGVGAAPGSFEICPVCFWKDGAVQLRWPDFAGGANRPSLIGSQ